LNAIRAERLTKSNGMTRLIGGGEKRKDRRLAAAFHGQSTATDCFWFCLKMRKDLCG